MRVKIGKFVTICISFRRKRLTTGRKVEGGWFSSGFFFQPRVAEEVNVVNVILMTDDISCYGKGNSNWSHELSLAHVSVLSTGSVVLMRRRFLRKIKIPGNSFSTTKKEKVSRSTRIALSVTEMYIEALIVFVASVREKDRSHNNMVMMLKREMSLDEDSRGGKPQLAGVPVQSPSQSTNHKRGGREDFQDPGSLCHQGQVKTEVTWCVGNKLHLLSV